MGFHEDIHGMIETARQACIAETSSLHALDGKTHQGAAEANVMDTVSQVEDRRPRKRWFQDVLINRVLDNFPTAADLEGIWRVVCGPQGLWAHISVDGPHVLLDMHCANADSEPGKLWSVEAVPITQ